MIPKDAKLSAICELSCGSNFYEAGGKMYVQVGDEMKEMAENDVRILCTILKKHMGKTDSTNQETPQIGHS